VEISYNTIDFSAIISYIIAHTGGAKMRSVMLFFVVAIVVCLAFCQTATAWAAITDDFNGDGKSEVILETNRTEGSGGTFYDFVMKQGQVELLIRSINLPCSFLVRDVTTRYAGKELIFWTSERFKDNYAKTGSFVFYWYGWDKESKRYTLYGCQTTKKEYGLGKGKDAFNDLPDKSGTSNSFYKGVQVAEKLIHAVRDGNWKIVRACVEMPAGDIEMPGLADVKKYKARFSSPLVVPSYQLIDGMADESEENGVSIDYYKASGHAYYTQSGKYGTSVSLYVYKNGKICCTF
jgi:hypothetical protein